MGRRWGREVEKIPGALRRGLPGFGNIPDALRPGLPRFGNIPDALRRGLPGFGNIPGALNRGLPGFTSTFTRGFIPVVLRTPTAECALVVLEPLWRLQ